MRSKILIRKKKKTNTNTSSSGVDAGRPGSVVHRTGLQAVCQGDAAGSASRGLTSLVVFLDRAE